MGDNFQVKLRPKRLLNYQNIFQNKKCRSGGRVCISGTDVFACRCIENSFFYCFKHFSIQAKVLNENTRGISKALLQFLASTSKLLRSHRLLVFTLFYTIFSFRMQTSMSSPSSCLSLLNRDIFSCAVAIFKKRFPHGKSYFNYHAQNQFSFFFRANSRSSIND